MLDVRDFLSRYADAFAARDTARIAAFYDRPCLLLRADGASRNFDSREEIVAAFERILAAYIDEGMAGFAHEDAGLHTLGQLCARLSCRWRMFGPNGPIRDWSQTYLLRLARGRARIAASVVHT